MTAKTKNVLIALSIIGVVVASVFIYIRFQTGDSIGIGEGTSFAGVEILVPGTTDVFVALDETSPSSTNDYPMGTYDNGPTERGTIVLLDDMTATLEGGRTLAVFAHNSGGSGEFFYLALFVGKNINYLASYPIGDRVDITDITVTGTTVTVDYLVHGEGQAMVEVPSTPATLTVEVQGDLLVRRI